MVGCRLLVFVKPFARASKVVSIPLSIHSANTSPHSMHPSSPFDSVHIQLAASPQNNQANGELLAFLCHLLKICKSEISLIQGRTSR